MPSIDLSILNQRQTPAFYADTLANRPAAGFVGRIFVSTDTFAFFRDNGTGWDLIGGPGTGTVTGSGAAGQVSFWNGASSITGSNDLFWDSVNGHLGVGTVTPGTALDVKHDQNTVVQLEQITATNDIRIAFINSGVGLWRIGSFYNAGANDFGIFDVVGAIQPVTVKKTTGQVLIGTSTVGTGKLTVASATGDNHIQIVGATSPSLRIDSAESGPTKRIGIGLATAVNNFIQNSQNLDMCIFNGSTSAAGNMLFGIYDTGLANVQEAARISSARNFLIGTITDTGQKLQVSGTANITGLSTFGNNVLIGIDSVLGINTTDGTDNGYLAICGASQDGVTRGGHIYLSGNERNTDAGSVVISTGNTSTGTGAIAATVFRNAGSESMRLSSSNNLLIGTTTDAGQKLQVNGTSFLNGNVQIGLDSNPFLNIANGGSTNVTSGINWLYGSGLVNGGGIEMAAPTGNSFYMIFKTRNAGSTAERMRIKENGVINLTSIPTSAAGLSSGDIYSNLGILTIVP
jgi:hypothetical protein